MVDFGAAALNMGFQRGNAPLAGEWGQRPRYAKRRNTIDNERNSYGLYDRPISAGAAEITLTQEILERQIEDGAFVLDREEALKAGLLNPYDDDAILIRIGETL
jgi:hypothetical protein